MAGVAGEKPEAVLQAVADLLDGHDSHSGRCQFDREGEPVYSLAYRTDRVVVSCTWFVGWLHLHGSRNKQLDCVTARERGEPPGDLALHLQGLATCHEHAQIRSCPEKGVNEQRDLLDQVLRVVESEYEVLPLQLIAECLLNATARFPAKPELRRHCCRDVSWFGHVPKLDPDDPALEAVEGFERQPALADPTRSGQGDYPGPHQLVG
jgi:hypothetical protein